MTWWQVIEVMHAAQREPFPWAIYILGGLIVAEVLLVLWLTFKGDEMQKYRATSLMATILLIAALAAIAGCATVAGTLPVQGAAENQLEKVTKVDLDSAIAQATAAGDDQAVKCFTLVQDFVGKGAPAADIKGVFSAFEATRLLRKRVDTGVPEDLHIACAPLILDARVTLVKLGLIAAGAGL
jgi:hypothetical protein